MALWIVLAIVVALVAAAIITSVIKKRKGSLTINLTKTAFLPGETCHGSIALILHKQNTGQKLSVALVGTEETSQMIDQENKTSRKEVYRDEQILDNERHYAASFSETYNLDLTIPAKAPSSFSVVESTEYQSTRESNGSMLFGHSSSEQLTNSRRRLVWHLETQLELDGIDLSDRVSISVS